MDSSTHGFIRWLLFDKSTYLYAGRENLKKAKKDYDKTEDDLKSLQSVGQIIGEVLRPLDSERCKWKDLLLLVLEQIYLCTNMIISILFLAISFIITLLVFLPKLL